MKVYRTNKIPYSISNHAEKFLNGLTSNTLDAPNNSFLTIHGKIIATFDQIKISDDHFLILIEQQFCNDVLKHIDRYVKLSQVKVEQEDYHVYFILSGDCPASPKNFVIHQKNGHLLITREELSVNVSDEEFTLFRVHNNIPLHGVDYKDEMLLNVSTTDFVSFTKGCFLGQEPISKVYNRSRPTWQLVVKTEAECDDSERKKMTSKVIDPDSGQPIGFVFTRNQ